MNKISAKTIVKALLMENAPEMHNTSTKWKSSTNPEAPGISDSFEHSLEIIALRRN
jgi:hypothetical protein